MNKEYAKEILTMGFMKINNFRLVELKKDTCIVEGIVSESSYNPYNFIHGGYNFGLIDTTSSLLVNTLDDTAITSSESINYISRATGNKLIAKAKILKQGKNISNIEVEVFDSKKVFVAKGIVNFFNVVFGK